MHPIRLCACTSENESSRRIIIFSAFTTRIVFKKISLPSRQTDGQIDRRIKLVLLQYGNVRLCSLPIRAVTSEMP